LASFLDLGVASEALVEGDHLAEVADLVADDEVREVEEQGINLSVVEAHFVRC
jgi:hypothetical protein